MKDDDGIIEWFQDNKPQEYTIFYGLRYSGITQEEINKFMRIAYNNYMKLQSKGADNER